MSQEQQTKLLDALDETRAIVEFYEAVEHKNNTFGEFISHITDMVNRLLDKKPASKS